MTLPVSVDPSEPTHYAILGRVERSKRSRRAQRGGHGGGDARRGRPGGARGRDVNVVDLSGGALTEAQREKLRMLGLDPDAVAGQAAPAPDPEPDPDDTLAQLERLAALKADGVLTEDEFAAQKRRILGE